MWYVSKSYDSLTHFLMIIDQESTWNSILLWSISYFTDHRVEAYCGISRADRVDHVSLRKIVEITLFFVILSKSKYVCLVAVGHHIEMYQYPFHEEIDFTDYLRIVYLVHSVWTNFWKMPVLWINYYELCNYNISKTYRTMKIHSKVVSY